MKSFSYLTEYTLIKLLNRVFILFLFLYSGIFANAADTVIVKKDPRLDILSSKLLQANQRSGMMTASGLYKGYRLQVLSTTRRDDAFRMRAELLGNFPDLKTYVIFQSPSFKVRVGNFLKWDDAEKCKIMLNKHYPKGVYIVEDAIEYTPPEDGGIITQ